VASNRRRQALEFSGRRESILGGFGLDILSRTPAELQGLTATNAVPAIRHSARSEAESQNLFGGSGALFMASSAKRELLPCN